MQKKDKYVYPAVFSFYDNSRGEGIGVTFPDLPGCVSCAEDISNVLHMAAEALGLHLFGMEEDGDEIPEPSDVFEIKKQLEPNQILTLVEVFMPRVRDAVNNKAINKTVTLPQWLLSEARAEDINFSQTLQDALMEKLGIKRKIKRRIYKK